MVQVEERLDYNINNETYSSVCWYEKQHCSDYLFLLLNLPWNNYMLLVQKWQQTIALNPKRNQVGANNFSTFC